MVNVQHLHTTLKTQIQATPVLWAEPMKKKKKVDPAIVRFQQDRKRRRIEKQIRRLERFAKKLKPVDEFELDREIKKDIDIRQRTNSSIDKEESEQLTNEWMVYCKNRSTAIHTKFNEMISAQEIALSELKLESSELYEQAVQVRDDLVPYSFTGPCETPPIPNYMRDGVYKETTKSYELDPDVVKTMLRKAERSGGGKK